MDEDKVWDMFKERIVRRWDILKDSELDYCRNDFERLCLKIQEISQEPKTVIQNFVDNLWFELFVRPSRQNMIKNQLNLEASEF